MKKILLYTLFIFSLYSGSVYAQRGKAMYGGRITVSPVAFQQRGDSLYVELNMTYNGTNIKKNDRIDIIPVLSSAEAKHFLPMVSIMGKRKYREYRRKVSLMSARERFIYMPPFSIQYDARRGSAVRYQKVLKYESWMSDSELDIYVDICGCGFKEGSDRIEMERIADKVTMQEPYQVIPYVSYIQPENEVQKKREARYEVKLNFHQNSSILNPSYRDNQRTIKKLMDSLNYVKDAKGVEVERFLIRGYASPEGASERNETLSSERARALMNYIQDSFQFERKKYELNFVGVDWDGLAAAVKKSNMDSKSAILDIIENEPSSRRNGKLMSLENGTAYNYLYREIYPLLRKAVVITDYKVQGFNVFDAREVIKTHPQNLSLDEMYQLANTYKEGSPEFIDVFETAVRIFPMDETALQNAASSALERRDTILAERYLSKIKKHTDKAEYKNSMGILFLLKGDLDRAETYLKAADESGLSAARKNLRELQRKREQKAGLTSKK